MKISRVFGAYPAMMLLLLLTISLAACSIGGATPRLPQISPRPTPGGGENTIDLTNTDFVQHALTVKHGSEVVFVVRSWIRGRIFSLPGKNGQCDPSLPGPQELRQDGGFSVDAGQILTLEFPSPGVYPITCSIYPSMNLVITVT